MFFVLEHTYIPTSTGPWSTNPMLLILTMGCAAMLPCYVKFDKQHQWRHVWVNLYSFKVCPPLIAKQQFLNGLCSVINHTSHSESFFIMARKITQSKLQPRTARPRKAGCSSSATCSSAKKKPNKQIRTKSGKVCSRPVPPAIEDLLAGAVGLMSCCHIAVIYMPLPIINQLYYISKLWARCHSQLSRSHCSCTSLSS